MAASYTPRMFDHGMSPGILQMSEGRDIALALRRRDIPFVQSLVEQYHYRLVRYFIYLLGRRDGVDDLVQETWLRVLERGTSFDGRGRFEPWLFTVARNLAIDETRRKRTLSLDDDRNYDGHLPIAQPRSNAPSPFVLAARSQNAERLATTLQSLEPLSREVLLLRFQEDLSLQEIAAIVGAPVSTIASRIYRALATLRAQFVSANLPDQDLPDQDLPDQDQLKGADHGR